MIQHLKLEIFIVRFVVTRLARLMPTLFPTVLAQAGKSYLSLFILGVMTLACTELYDSAASQNDRTYVAFIMLLSFVGTTKAILVSFKKLAAWIQRRTQSAQAPPRSAQPASVAIGVLTFVTLSLIPPIIVFQVQHLIWAEHMCAIGFFIFAGAVTVLTILTRNFPRIRNLVAKLPQLLPRVPLIDFSRVAGQMYQESGKPVPRER